MEDQKDPAARAQDALSRITQEAYDKTGGDVYGTEPPAEPPVDSPPATEQPEASPAPASQTETPAQEPTSEPARPIFGKYKSIEEAERAYWEAVHMGNSAKAKLDEVQKVAVGTPPPETDPLDDMEAYGMPKELMAKVIDSRAEAIITRMFAPAVQRAEADKQIIQAHPEYKEKFSDIEKFIESQPEIAQQVIELNNSGKYLAARQIAYLNWKVAQANVAVETKTAAESARKEEVKDARRDAGVGTTRRSDTRTAPEVKEITKEDEKRLLDLYKAGHPAPYLRAKLDSLLPPNFDEVSAQLVG